MYASLPIAAACLGILGAALPCEAQAGAANQREVAGRVVERRSGAAVAGALLSLVSSDLSAITGEDGSFAPAIGGLTQLATYRPPDCQLVEVIAGGVQIRAYTHSFMERLARRPRALLPIILR